MVAEMDVFVHKSPLGDYDAGTLVSTDERQLGWNRPIAVDGVQVGVAHARVLDVEQNLIRARLGDWDVFENH